MSERGTSEKSINGQKKQLSDSSSSLALYRKYRPTSLKEVVGQPQVTKILQAAADRGEFAHAYLLTGQKGTGKTSVARILAHLINGTDYNSEDIDIIEIDAASRGSVDDARELREKSFIAPVSSTHKIYIIDEVHMLSTPAFNALLKIIEEPPRHVVFILATTEIQKVPATILSRVQRFHFRPVKNDTVANHLKAIAKEEKIAIDDEAIDLISERGGGSFRDSISLLDQLSGSDEKINRQTVEEILGLAPDNIIDNIVQSVINRKPEDVINYLNSLYREGINANLITNQIINKIIKLASDKPKLYSLIDKLLDVNKSSSPNIKLTAVLSMSALKTTTLSTAAISSREESKLAVIIEENIVTEINSDRESKELKISNTKLKTKQRSETVPDNISWSKIMNELQNLNQPALLATLKSANVDYDDGRLTLYFDKNFHRKKADTPKFRDSLSQVCVKLYGMAPKIIVAEGTKQAADSKDSLIANVAAIMGGGDIVKET